MEDNNPEIRRRKGDDSEEKQTTTTTTSELSSPKTDSKLLDTNCKQATLDVGSYWLTRIVFLRSLAFIYCKLEFFINTFLSQ